MEVGLLYVSDFRELVKRKDVEIHSAPAVFGKQCLVKKPLVVIYVWATNLCCQLSIVGERTQNGRESRRQNADIGHERNR